MSMRYASKAQAVTGNAAATLFAHGLGTTPDEYTVVQHGASGINLVAASAPDFTNIYVSAVTGGGTASVFAAVNHTWVK